MEEFIGLAAVIMIFGIPLSAIVGGIWLKSKKISQGQLSGKDNQLLMNMAKENQELKRRMENMETIVNDVDIDLVKLNAHTKGDFERKIDRMKEVEKVKKDFRS
jgi:hypothetical protein